MAASLDSPAKRIIRVKRKISETQDVTVFSGKKFKFLGSSQKGDDDTVKKLIVTKTPTLAVFDDDLLITDFEHFITETNAEEKLSKKLNDVGLEGHDDKEDGLSDDKYVYDVYLYEATDDEERQLFVSDSFNEVRDDEYSSNDEDNPNNDYPDDDEVDLNEYDYYRDYEDDETREMMREFETHCIDPDKERDGSGHEDELDDESWARGDIVLPDNQ